LGKHAFIEVCYRIDTGCGVRDVFGSWIGGDNEKLVARANRKLKVENRECETDFSGLNFYPPLNKKGRFVAAIFI
jgi:hypothetical protein